MTDALFDWGPPPTPPKRLIRAVGKTFVVAPELHDIALLYTATETGTNSGVRFALPTIAEAQTWCSSPISRRRGGRGYADWAYFYTSVANFIACHWGTQKPALSIDGCYDDGRADDDLAAMGLHKIDLYELRHVLARCGVEVKGTPRVDKPRRAAA